MNHLIEFREDATVILTAKGVQTTVQIRAGVQVPADVRCYVLGDANRGYTEVADVEVEEGLLKALPCTAFMFIDELG
jgi:hypothetical protein